MESELHHLRAVASEHMAKPIPSEEPLLMDMLRQRYHTLGWSYLTLQTFHFGRWPSYYPDVSCRTCGRSSRYASHRNTPLSAMSDGHMAWILDASIQ